jgi:hypothetical protein
MSLLAPRFVAHGGVAGAVIEFALVLGVVAVFVAVWLRERRASRDDDES